MSKFKFIKVDKNQLDKKEMYRTLDVNGKLINNSYTTALSKKQLLEAYEYMVLSRQQDTYMTQLQRQGRMLTFAPNFGEEALQVATSMAMKKDDWFIPAFRSNALMLHRGVPLINQMRYWNGNEDGSKMPEDVNVLPINIPIGTQYSHAAGIGYSLKLQGKKNVSVTFIGDGGTSEGEFYEAMNIAAVNKWPTVFCINNNQWAISTPTKKETKSSTLAIKAVAVGIPGLRVDGNDLLASYEVANEAIQFAREGNGPVLIEFFTWRQGVHTSSDNPKIYRTREAEIENEKWEPFHRIKNYLISQKLLTEAEDKKIWATQLELVKKTYQESLIDLEESVDEVFDYTYKTLTKELEVQKQEAKSIFEVKGDK